MERIKVILGFDKVPKMYTAEGQNTSPPITVEGAEGKSMAIIMEDPDAKGETWVHWVIWNIPVMGSVPENVPKNERPTHPLKAVQGTNTGDELGYDGPYPPKGHGPHRYFFKVYVLDSMLDLGPGATKDQLLKAMEGKVLQQGEAMATYERA